MAAHFHHVPGRIRVHVPSVKGNTDHAREMETHIGELTGVTRVESRVLTGSVIVQYDPKIIDAQLVWRRLRESGAVTAAPATHPRMGAKVAEAVAWYILDKAVERTIPLLLAALL